ncbi:hypothetical protein [Moraxella lacunata]|uniref:hypothetical protein n=1 Tax=Moraxella lacunata TaxID=477 RepID=UPI003EDEEA7C
MVRIAPCFDTQRNATPDINHALIKMGRQVGRSPVLIELIPAWRWCVGDGRWQMGHE